MKALLARDAKTQSRERLGQTALMWAAAEGHTAVVRALIDAGADINATVDSGFKAFFFAVRGYLDTVRSLAAGRCECDDAASPERGRRRGRGVRSRQDRHKSLDPAVQNGTSSWRLR